MYKNKIESIQKKKLIIYTGQLEVFYKPQQNFCELIFLCFQVCIPQYLIQHWSQNDNTGEKICAIGNPSFLVLWQARNYYKNMSIGNHS